MRSLRFPPLTEESRYCRDGHHKTLLTPIGQIAVMIVLAFAVALASIAGGLLVDLWKWYDVSGWMGL